MFFSSRHSAIAGLIFLLAAAGCSRNSEREAAGRIAVLPFENLSGDAAFDWAGSAIQEIVVSDLTGAAKLDPVATGTAREAAGVKRILSGYYAQEGGALRFHGVLRDAASGKTISSYLHDAPVLEAGNRMARSVTAEARPYGTTSEVALRAYLEGTQTGALEPFEKALSADAGYGEAWVALVRRQAQSAGRDKALEVVERARQHNGKFHKIERARIELLAATLRNDTAAQVRLLEELTRLTPADGSLPGTVAQAYYATRDFAKAAEWYRKAAVAGEGDAQGWNLAIYAHAFAGDYARAKDAFESYRKAAPENPNPFDSMGEVDYYFGRFDAAEKSFLEANRLAPSFLGGWTLRKAAQARLMLGGDPAQAGESFKLFLEARKQANDPLIEYYGARWDYLTGKHAEATKRLEAWLKGEARGDMAALANAQLAAWKLAEGDRVSALALSAAALKVAQSPPARFQAFVVQFSAQPKATVAEWQVRAARALPEPAAAGLRNQMVCYALLLDKDFVGAVEGLQALHAQTQPPNAGEAAVLLAWAYVESGQSARAKPLVERSPIPNLLAPDVFEFLQFPRALALRKALGL